MVHSIHPSNQTEKEENDRIQIQINLYKTKIKISPDPKRCLYPSHFTRIIFIHFGGEDIFW